MTRRMRQKNTGTFFKGPRNALPDKSVVAISLTGRQTRRLASALQKEGVYKRVFFNLSTTILFLPYKMIRKRAFYKKKFESESQPGFPALYRFIANIP